MTIIEFFEKSPFENMISCLTAKPNKLIFLGEMEQMEKTLPIYEKFLEEKKLHTKIEPRQINKNDLKNIVETLTEIVRTEQDCIFDITGGEDLLILGCGIVFATYRDLYPIKLQRFDLENGKIIDCDCDDEVSFKGAFKVTVNELIALYGGVVSESPQPEEDAEKRDVDILWKMASTKRKVWNESVKYLKEFEKRSRNKMAVNLALAPLRAGIYNFQRKLTVYSQFLQELSHHGIITRLQISKDFISYRYKNATVQRCLNSPGDILEMKVLFEARDLKEDGKPFFDSCHIGVKIDWDGVIRHFNDTKNEIDVILMRALTPVFISCKIGEIDEIEPYKLWTVAERFGGAQVKKVLIASDFTMKTQEAEASFRNRVKEMGITFVPDANTMTDSEWQTFFKNLID